MSIIDFKEISKRVSDFDTYTYYGIVEKISGLSIEANGPMVEIGKLCKIYSLNEENWIYAEVVGFRQKSVMLMPFGDLKGIGPGSKVVSTNSHMSVNVSNEVIGRILDGLGKPIDNKGPIKDGDLISIENQPLCPLKRKRIKNVLPLGIKAIDGLLTCGVGQRIGVFAGSGVGKSTLIGMIARNSEADLNVIALVGERGREVNDFIEKDLREDGLKKSVLVVATSDQPALVRLKSAMLATAIAEYFREQGKNVLLLMDSITRFAMAQREVGMSVGEPPVSRGYTPSVFSLLPKLLERSGNSDKGSVTALYTVLVEGDDLNEPITDAVRGILDGHIVLSRDLANRNHYPAIDILTSVSRLMPDIVSKQHFETAGFIKSMMAVYKDAEDIINIGAYKKGSNSEIDRAIALNKDIKRFLHQGMNESVSFQDTIRQMTEIKDGDSDSYEEV
jgi:flagellum-specific ATP synthase